MGFCARLAQAVVLAATASACGHPAASPRAPAEQPCEGCTSGGDAVWEQQCTWGCDVESGAPASPGEDDSSDESLAEPGGQIGEGAVLGAEGVLGCPVRFESQAVGWHEVSGQFYFVDEFGRPAGARASLPPLVADDARDEACQGAVGRWGDASGTGDYDGGHLIAYQLGGWGGRANLVPQNANFNRGNWAQVENAIARCDELEPGQLELSVVVEYDASDALVPSVMAMVLRDRRGGAETTLRFENVAQGGAGGPATCSEGVAWLRALGCGP